MKILVFDGGALSAHGRARLRAAARAALGARARARGELCLILAGDAEVRRINKQFLGHDHETDVIAFPYAGGPPVLPGTDAPFADVYISRGVARRQAREMGHDELTELMTLAVHGVLHLAGYDDRRPADRRRMFAKQDVLLRRLRPSRAHGKKG